MAKPDIIVPPQGAVITGGDFDVSGQQNQPERVVMDCLVPSTVRQAHLMVLHNQDFTSCGVEIWQLTPDFEGYFRQIRSSGNSKLLRHFWSDTSGGIRIFWTKGQASLTRWFLRFRGPTNSGRPRGPDVIDMPDPSEWGPYINTSNINPTAGGD